MTQTTQPPAIHTPESLLREMSHVLRDATVSADSGAGWAAKAKELLASVDARRKFFSCEAAIDSIEARLDWAERTLRDTANRGREGLGDSYPEVLSVLGALRASLEVIEKTRQPE